MNSQTKPGPKIEQEGNTVQTPVGLIVCSTESMAVRCKHMIEQAYVQGRHDKRNEIQQALGGP